MSFIYLFLLFQTGTPAKPGKNFMIWWQNEHFIKEAQITPEQKQELAILDNLQAEFLLEHTRLQESRSELWSMVENDEIKRADIERFQRTHVAKSSQKILDINLEGRLSARQILSKSQIQTILKRYPKFFQRRWFRASRLPVYKGKVNPLGEAGKEDQK